MMLVKVLKVGVLRRWLYMAVKPLQVGLMQMDYLAPLHHPSACRCRLGVQSSWFKIVLP
jgi:hypothetical protein